MIIYNSCRMDSPVAITSMNAMLGAVAAHGALTAAGMSELAGVKPRMAGLYTTYLCSIGRLGIAEKATAAQGRSKRAVYCIGSNTDPLPLIDGGEDEYRRDIARPTQRTISASNWPRGEHAYRSGLLAVLFPFERELTAQEA